MGFTVKADLDTSLGQSNQIYIRIESFQFDRIRNTPSFNLSFWKKKSYAHTFNKLTIDEPKKKSVGMVQERIIYYSTDNSEGEVILLPHTLTFPLTSEKDIEKDVFEVKDVEVEVPYVSFDENGEEIMKVRKVKRTSKVKTGVKSERLEVVDYEILGNFVQFGYDKLKQELLKYFPEDKIIVD